MGEVYRGWCGQRMPQLCIEHAKRSGAEKIAIVFKRKCVHAVRFYRKFGFREVPMDKASSTLNARILPLRGRWRIDASPLPKTKNHGILVAV